MKTLIFSFVLVLFAGFTNAQEITELKEAKVNFAPLSSEVTRSGDNFHYQVNEHFVGEFENDPLVFVNNHFNVQSLISGMSGERYNSYFVTFKSSKGSLEADFNKKGELVKSRSKFKDILLPNELRHQLYREYKGWEMVKNVHITRGRDGVVNQDIYKIKLRNGKERKNITFAAPVRGAEVAGN